VSRCVDIYVTGRKKGQQCEQMAAEGLPWCPSHKRWHKADILRMQGLRTVPKPGDPDFAEKRP
jgi:hypothetical protein